MIQALFRKCEINLKLKQYLGRWDYGMRNIDTVYIPDRQIRRLYVPRAIMTKSVVVFFVLTTVFQNCHTAVSQYIGGGIYGPSTILIVY
jgi:hypothetical protein